MNANPKNYIYTVDVENAYLISAAPDMYEALKTLKIRFDLAMLDLSRTLEDEIAITKAEKALAKAEGKK